MMRLWGMLLAVLVLCSAVENRDARAMIIWGYDGSPQMEEKYRHLIVDHSNPCATVRRNTSPAFILSPYLDQLTGIGSRVNMKAPGCIQNLDHAQVTLVTPRHVIVSESLGIWQQAQTVAFVGSDNQVYVVKTRPGYRVLSHTANPGLNTNIALVELEATLPASVSPMHVASFSLQHMQQIKNGMTYYAFGNAHPGINYRQWQSYGDPNAKAVGVNQIVLAQGSYSGHGISTDGLVQDNLRQADNPASGNWNDYWRTEQAQAPHQGVAFMRAYDTSSPSVVLIADSAGKVRPHVFGLNWTYNTSSSLGFVHADLLQKIAEYNQATGSSYAINSASLKTAAVAR
jgi:hypothetical protein